MASAALLEQARQEAWSDEQVVSRVLAGQTALYELLMRRYNQRLYRVARAILHDNTEAEDVMQDAFVRGYQHLSEFEGRAKFSTWLTRIAVHEAVARSRRRLRFQSLDNSEESNGGIMGSLASAGRDPEEATYDRELGEVLEKAILRLPEDYRLIFMLRDVEGISTDETAECLNLTPENVKVRLHRARAGLRRELFARAGATTAESFQFHDTRCDRVVKNVFSGLRGINEPESNCGLPESTMLSKPLQEESTESKARLFGHPIHAMLIVFPLGLLATAVAFDIVGLAQAGAEWFRISFWMIAAGIIGGLLAAVFGLADLLAIPSGTRAQKIALLHGGGNVVVVLLFVVSWFLRRSVPENPPTGAFVLSFVAAALAVITGWLGGELVYRLGVGVDKDAQVNAPSSLSSRPAKETAAQGSRLAV